MSIENLDCAEFDSRRCEPDTIVIDVREPHEFDAGHIPGAISLPLSVLSSTPVPVAKNIILYCQSGYRSKVAAEFIAYQCQEGKIIGIEHLAHLKPGYLKWSAAHQL